MRSAPLPQRPLHFTLATLTLLVAPLAHADLPHETFYLSREEISDEALRGVIGIAFIRSIPDPDQQPPTGELTCFTPDGDTFEPDGSILLKEARAISGWDGDTESVRKFPVVERRGNYLHVVIDARTNERVWLSEVQEAEQGPDVEFLSFDSEEWSWSGISLFFLAPTGETRLYGAPRLDSRSHLLSPAYPLRKNGEVVHSPRIMGAKGDFMQLGIIVELALPLEPVGWVPITDEDGLLLIWPIYAPMC
jgi:hypothetical protein